MTQPPQDGRPSYPGEGGDDWVDPYADGPGRTPEDPEPTVQQPYPTYPPQQPYPPQAYPAQPPAAGPAYPPQPGTPPYGYAPYGQPTYPPYAPQGASYPPPAWQPAPPSHPKATSAMVLGIVAIAGGLACYLPLFLAPFAWIRGAAAQREIDAEQGRWGGRSEATTGKILGIVGTVLLVLALLFVAFIIVLAIVSPESFEDDSAY
ncbi:MAG: DUF4190 domain-containing protein [Aeromicrobium erythreum]